MLGAVAAAPKPAPKKPKRAAAKERKRSGANLLHVEAPSEGMLRAFGRPDPEKPREPTWPLWADRLLGPHGDALYRESRNPLLPWLCRRAARAAKRPIPSWVDEAFDRWSENLAQALAQYDRPWGTAESQRLVADAFELTGAVGSGGPFSDLRQQLFDESAMSLVDLALREGKARPEALDFAANFFGCDPRTVARALKRRE